MRNQKTRRLRMKEKRMNNLIDRIIMKIRRFRMGKNMMMKIMSQKIKMIVLKRMMIIIRLKKIMTPRKVKMNRATNTGNKKTTRTLQIKNNMISMKETKNKSTRSPMSPNINIDQTLNSDI